MPTFDEPENPEPQNLGATWRGARDHTFVDMPADILEFHEKFSLPYGDDDRRPRLLPQDLLEFRLGFMQEELDEYREAHELGDKAKALDALVDLAYVALGTAYLHGFPFAEAWRRVQVANMAKVRTMRAEDSTRASAWDVTKPAGWEAPDHSDLVTP